MVNRAIVLRGRMGAHAPGSSAPDATLYEQAKTELAQLMAEREAEAATARLVTFAQRIVSKAPPLSAEQRERITLALRKAGE